jgi:hypothetical protein
MKDRRYCYLFFVVVIVLLNHCPVLAQLSVHGTPLGSSFEQIDGMEVKEHLMVNQQAYLTQAEEQEKQGQPLQFAYQFTVNYTPENSGSWEIQEDGTKVWRVLISSPGAYSINLIFDRYNLPEGASLFIYNIDMSAVIGAFTSINNKKSGVLATAPVAGDEIIVEYQEPASVEYSGELMIGAVNHDFLGVNDYVSLKSTGFGASGDCNEDISCYDSDNAIDIRRSVVKLLIDGSYLCTGTLINNTNEDGTPYVITAAHCFDGEDSKDGSTAFLYFNYESPYCSEVIEGSDAQTLSGGDLKVYAEAQDIALLQMYDTPPADYRPYYAGWTLESSPSSPYVCIHHPSGDVKKIATATDDVVASSFNYSSLYPYAQVDNFHWLVEEWTTGTTEGGSSGSGLFDTDYKLIGTLSGGFADCNDPINDYFVQFYKAWDSRSEDTCQFEVWLDPTNSGTQILDGYDPYEDDAYERITNVESGESPAVEYYNGGNGYISGHNSLGVTLYAEQFTGIQSASIKGVYIMPGQSVKSSTQTIDLIIWEGNAEPDNIVKRESDIALNTLTEDEEAYIEFDQEVEVEGTFFVGYEIDYSQASIDSFAVYHSAGDNSKVVNTMMLKENDSWQLGTEVFGGDNKSLWIDVLAETVIYGDTQIVSSDDDQDVILYPNPVINTNTVYLDVQNQYIDYYSVIDVSGRVLQTTIVQMEPSSALSIDLSGFSNGEFFIKVILDGNCVVKKIVKSGTN